MTKAAAIGSAQGHLDEHAHLGDHEAIGFPKERLGEHACLKRYGTNGFPKQRPNSYLQQPQRKRLNPEKRGSGATFPLCLSFWRYRVDGMEEVQNQNVTRLYDTEESAAREAFGQHATRKYDTEESAASKAGNGGLLGRDQHRDWQPIYY